MTRIFVLVGQGGRLTSGGMVALAERLRQYGETTVHGWSDAAVLPSIDTTKGKIAVIGYSLGANQLGWLSAYVKRTIDLGVAYDPSRLSPLVKQSSQGVYSQTAIKFTRLLCYRNIGAWFFGGSTYIGKNVEETQVSSFHLGVQFDAALHQKTLAAVEKLVGKK